MLAYAVISDDPTAMDKVKLFFDMFSQLPSWFTNLWILVVASIYGIKEHKFLETEEKIMPNKRFNKQVPAFKAGGRAGKMGGGMMMKKPMMKVGGPMLKK